MPITWTNSHFGGRRDLEIEAGLILAGTLFIDLPKRMDPQGEALSLPHDREEDHAAVY
jgi:hypothetical protein